MGHASPYGRDMEATIQRLFPFNSCRYNQVYKNNDGLYVYENTRGYIHIMRPERILFDGKFSHFTIIDYMLTKDSTIHETGRTGNYKDITACIDYLESLLLKPSEEAI